MLFANVVISAKWIKDLNVRLETIRLLENLHGFGYDFLTMTLKILATETKKDSGSTPNYEAAQQENSHHSKNFQNGGVCLQAVHRIRGKRLLLIYINTYTQNCNLIMAKNKVTILEFYLFFLKERNKSSYRLIHFHLLVYSSLARFGPGCSWEPGTQSGSVTWVAGTQLH